MTYRAEVKHERNRKGGIFAYFSTVSEAATWIATWQDAVWAHIEAIEVDHQPTSLTRRGASVAEDFGILPFARWVHCMRLWLRGGLVAEGVASAEDRRVK